MDINYLPNEININRLGLSCILESRFGVNVLGAALKISVLKRGVVERRRNNVGYMGSTHGQKWSSSHGWCWYSKEWFRTETSHVMQKTQLLYPRTYLKFVAAEWGLISLLLSFLLYKIMLLGWEMLLLLNNLLCKNEIRVWTPSTHGKSCVRPCWSVILEWGQPG